MRTRLLCVMLIALCSGACAQQYAPALPGYHYEFPRDHFNHPEYQTEWWYYTGNLHAKDGHRFGFELTFFRRGGAGDANATPWSLHDVYMAHLALTDVSGGRYDSMERLNRAGPGIAGIDAASGTVWNGNWQTKIGSTSHNLRGVGETFSFDLKAVPAKGLVIQGQNGISQKAAGAGNASHYISFTRMTTTGTITRNRAQYAVEGETWMDHEFFSDSTNSDEVGWDWLSVQLAGKSELMLYRLRHKDGSVDPYSSGTFVDSQGRSLHLALHDFSMVPTGETWKSAQTGATYPMAWTVTIPQLNLQLDISTPLKNQEFVSRFGPSYWEGAIDVSGRYRNQAVFSVAKISLTGQDDEVRCRGYGEPAFFD